MIKTWLERRYLNPKAKAIADSILNEPEKWTTDSLIGYSLRRGRPGAPDHVEICVYLGLNYVSILKPVEEQLGYLGRRRVWKAFKTWHKRKAEQDWKAQNENENAQAIANWN